MPGCCPLERLTESSIAARESLRTEAGYLLNGNDMDSATNPYEVGLGWVVKLSKNFVGKDALVRQKAEGVKRKLIGCRVQGRGIARHDYPILDDARQIGFDDTLQYEDFALPWSERRIPVMPGVERDIGLRAFQAWTSKPDRHPY